MSFRCGLCKRPMPNGSSPTRVVLETRNKVYPERVSKKLSDHPGFRPKAIDRGGEGWEIVREADVCKRCIRDMKEEKARENDRL